MADLWEQRALRGPAGAYVDLRGRAGTLLTTAEVAAQLHVNRRTITKWVQAGVLTPALTTPGGRYRWRWSEVEAQLRAQQRDRDA